MLGRFGIQEPQYAMASLPAIVEGPTAEEQMLKAEASCVSRQNDLQTLRHDKREFIKANRRALAKTPKFSETFGQVQSSDLPPQFRAILEDNRMLHEQVRTYKRELYETQAANTAHDKHIVRLQTEVKRVQEALQTCNRSPNEVSTERSAARTIQLQEEDLQRLRDKVSVLAHAKETDGRRFRQIAVERQREREDLKREVDRLKSLLAERDKAFRAQAFALKQLNTRVVQLQQQHTEQASREAALLQELSCGVIQAQTSSAESLVAPSEQGASLKRMQSCLPAGMETMRRRLEPMMSTGSTLQRGSMAVEPSEYGEDLEEEEATVRLMLVMLSQEAVQGFYQQVQREREEIARGERRDPSEAAIKIQSAWRMRQAQQELHRLRQAQEAQAEATATRQAVQERQNSLVSPGRAPVNRGIMRRPSTKPLKGSGQPQAEASTPKRNRSNRSSTGPVVPNSPSSRSPSSNTAGPAPWRDQNLTSLLVPNAASAVPDDSSKGSEGPLRQASSFKRPDSFSS